MFKFVDSSKNHIIDVIFEYYQRKNRKVPPKSKL